MILPPPIKEGKGKWGRFHAISTSLVLSQTPNHIASLVLVWDIEPRLLDKILSWDSVRGHTHMTSAKLLDFWIPYPLVGIWQLIYTIKFTQPWSLHLLFGDPLADVISVWSLTVNLNAKSCRISSRQDDAPLRTNTKPSRLARNFWYNYWFDNRNISNVLYTRELIWWGTVSTNVSITTFSNLTNNWNFL